MRPSFDPASGYLGVVAGLQVRFIHAGERESLRDCAAAPLAKPSDQLRAGARLGLQPTSGGEEAPAAATLAASRRVAIACTAPALDSACEAQAFAQLAETSTHEAHGRH